MKNYLTVFVLTFITLAYTAPAKANCVDQIKTLTQQCLNAKGLSVDVNSGYLNVSILVTDPTSAAYGAVLHAGNFSKKQSAVAVARCKDDGTAVLNYISYAGPEGTWGISGGEFTLDMCSKY